MEDDADMLRMCLSRQKKRQGASPRNSSNALAQGATVRFEGSDQGVMVSEGPVLHLVEDVRETLICLVLDQLDLAPMDYDVLIITTTKSPIQPSIHLFTGNICSPLIS